MKITTNNPTDTDSNHMKELLKHTTTDRSKLDMEKMLKAINEIVQVDFAQEMSIRDEYTQEEAKRMSEVIDSVYMVVHCMDCKACARKWYKTGDV